MIKIASFVLLIYTILLVVNCSGPKNTIKKIDSDSNDTLIQIDSIKYYYSICFSNCPIETTMVTKNGNVRVFNKDSAWDGQIDYRKTISIFYYIVKLKLYEWKCKVFCIVCDGNTVDFEIYSKESKWKISMGALCNDVPFDLVAIDYVLNNLVANAYWKSELPPLHYAWPTDSIMLKMEIEKAERKLSQLKEQNNEFRRSPKTPVDATSENRIQNEIETLNKQLDKDKQ